MRKKLFTFLLALVTSVGLSWAVPTEFANCYDCWRSPEYPNISGQCHLFNFGNPGVGNGNPSGPWKLEFVEYYNSSSTEYDDIVSSYAANQYLKSPEQMEVYRLYQWQNGAYQPVAYGVLYAYANENNAVEHAAFFEANGYWGCYFTDNTHSGGDDFNITFNEDASTGFADLHGGSTPTPTPDPEPTPTPTGDKLPGAFTVDGSGTQVYFSQGNLQATTNDQGATWTWGFAENQWDYVGDAAANTSFDYWGGTGNGSYDLFGWIGESSALTDYRQYGIGSNYDFTDCGNTPGENLKADWGSLMGSDWRTLTYDEWQYLIKSRNNAANLLAYATVNGKTGLILLPDSWTSSSVALTITTANYTTNIISASDWSTLEEQGCVFLPAAGWRSDDSVGGVGEGGDYWSSSSPSGKQYDEGSAYCFFFDTDFSKQADGMHFNKRGRGYGLSVRLVSETAPSPAPAPAGLQVTELQISASWENDQTLVTISDLPGFVAVSLEEAGAWDAVPAGDVVLIYAGTNEGVTATYFHNGAWGDPVPFGGFSRADIFEWASGSKIFYTSGGSTPAVDPAVQNVIDLINAIPNPVVYTQECYNALDAVYEAYRVLSPEQRDQVTNYDDYLAAEERYYMLGSVNNVIETINDIGNVEFTSECKHRIDYARSEYCNLTLEAKGYVTNYNTLLAAEAAYAALIPVSSTVVWDEAILETIDAYEWGEATYTNGSLSLKAVDGRARYVDIDDHFIFDGSNSEKSFVFSCTSANILRIEITVSEKHEHNELSCAWQETATGYRWVGEATSVDFASTVFKVTEIRFYLGEAFPEPTPTPAQDGDKLPGAFTVDGGKVVYFSKGNLQYLGNIDRWHFAENQWTIIGNAQASDNRDLFSWGTGDNPDSEDYSTYTEWGNNIEGNWRTLTVEEWTYLFNTRTDASSKYGTATVAGVVGLILLPDNYDGTAINTERTAWDNNVISGSEWAAYEAEGAVFLPAAGMSDAYGVYGVGEQGLYWSSTMDALSYQSINVFYGFNPFEGYWFNDVDAQSQPQERLSVRLVSETAPTPTPAPVTSYVVEFALGDAEGTAPTTVDVTIGEDITMPVNKTMYKAGYTLTAWSDGVNTYPIGESFTPANDVVLTPVFTANQADLLNASTDVTVKWYFGGDNGAPTTSYEGTSGLLVAQATIGDKTVDVKLAIDATSGKFAPQPATEWANVKVGTIFTYPYKEGMTVDVHTYSGNVTYYLADGNVTCGANDLYSFIEVTYPASAPTAVVIGDPNNASQIETFLTNNNGQTIDELIINRPVLNNMYNTLCLPFDMNAAQIAASSLNGVEIREFTGASVEGTTLNLSVGDPVNAVVAGRPYFVKYSAASQLDDLHFEDVTINNALLDNMAVTFDGVTFKGTFTPFVMPNGLNFQGGYLFLGQNNQLFWPNTSNPLKPFRAYFYVNVESSTPGNAPKYRGMPARIVEGKNVATGVENAQSANQSTKVIVNGQLIIIKNDVRYNAQGQIVK